MPGKKKISTYEKLVFVAYGFYLLLGLGWLLGSLNGGFFNVYAFAIIAVFGVQFYYRHRVTNLVLGIIMLFFSIYMMMEVVSGLVGKPDTIYQVMFWCCLFSLVLAGILIFSYTRLSFRDQEGG